MGKPRFSRVVCIFGGWVLACSSGGGDDKGGPDPSISPGSQTAPEMTVAPADPAPTGKACVTYDDCDYYYCRCNDNAVVNSRVCSQGRCQAASAHCDTACNYFNHDGWSGVYGGGDAPSTGGTTGSGGSSSTGGARATGGTSSSTGGVDTGGCSSASDCPTFSCGCTDGARLEVRDCFGGICLDAFDGCDSACADSGHGAWDGT
jgi:hypothetical protein